VGPDGNNQTPERKEEVPQGEWSPTLQSSERHKMSRSRERKGIDEVIDPNTIGAAVAGNAELDQRDFTIPAIAPRASQQQSQSSLGRRLALVGRRYYSLRKSAEQLAGPPREERSFSRAR